MHMDPAMPVFVGFVLTILILGLALRGCGSRRRLRI